MLKMLKVLKMLSTSRLSILISYLEFQRSQPAFHRGRHHAALAQDPRQAGHRRRETPARGRVPRQRAGRAPGPPQGAGHRPPQPREPQRVAHQVRPPAGHVVAQKDAEPQDGKTPTPSWVVGEVIDDEYAMTLPAPLPNGEYPVEIGVYDPRSGDRLKLANGDNRLVLATRLLIR